MMGSVAPGTRISGPAWPGMNAPSPPKDVSEPSKTGESRGELMSWPHSQYGRAPAHRQSRNMQTEDLEEHGPSKPHSCSLFSYMWMK